MPFYAIPVLPVLFAAEISLLDAIDGVFHELRVRLGILPTGAQGALQHHPVAHRGPRINGPIEVIVIFAEKLSIGSGPFAAIANLDLDYVRYGIVALFARTWIIALAVRRLARVEEKWSAGLRSSPPHP